MHTPPTIDYEWKALSIKQPYASQTANGVKMVENRNKGQFRDKTLRDRWIMIHASCSAQQPRGQLIWLAHIDGVYEKHELVDPQVAQWAQDGACIVFDTIIKLHQPVDVPGGLSTWTLKPSPIWKPPRKLSKKERNMTPTDLRHWRTKQLANYRTRSLKKRVALLNVILALKSGQYTYTRGGPP